MELSDVLVTQLIEALSEAKAARIVAERAMELALEAMKSRQPVASAEVPDAGSYVPVGATSDDYDMHSQLEDLAIRAEDATPKGTTDIAPSRKLSPFQAWGNLGVGERLAARKDPAQVELDDNLMEESLKGV